MIKINTTFNEMYDLFLSNTIDEYFIDEEKQDFSYNKLEGLLMSAIVDFTHPKQNLRDYDLNYIDIEGVRGRFAAELTVEEKKILSTYMAYEWANNKLQRGQIMDLQYTGADAKVLNISSIISTNTEIIKVIKGRLRTLRNNYHIHDNEGQLEITPRVGIRSTLDFENYRGGDTNEI